LRVSEGQSLFAASCHPAVIQVASTWRLLMAVFACLQKNDGSGYAALFRPSSNALNLTALLQIMPSQNQL